MCKLKVVPLTTNLGIIQWIEETTSLLLFMQNATKDTKNMDAKLKNMLDIYDKFISKSSTVKSPIDAYGSAAEKYSKEKTIAKFRELVNMIPFDIMK